VLNTGAARSTILRRVRSPFVAMLLHLQPPLFTDHSVCFIIPTGRFLVKSKEEKVER
jgi:hypothetical protein